MAHPQMFDEGDLGLLEVRQTALAFPDAIETVTFGRPMFRVGRIFAVYGGGTKGPDKRYFPHSLLFLPDEDTRLALLEESRFFIPGYFGPSGWLGLDLAAGEPDWQEVAELIDESYRNVASQRLIARLDAEGGPATRD